MAITVPSGPRPESGFGAGRPVNCPRLVRLSPPELPPPQCREVLEGKPTHTNAHRAVRTFWRSTSALPSSDPPGAGRRAPFASTDRRRRRGDGVGVTGLGHHDPIFARGSRISFRVSRRRARAMASMSGRFRLGSPRWRRTYPPGPLELDDHLEIGFRRHIACSLDAAALARGSPHRVTRRRILDVVERFR